MDNINIGWLFYDYDIIANPNGKSGEVVNLPHTNKFLPIQYFSESDYQFISSYKKIIEVKKEEGKLYILNFEGVMMKASLYINKKLVNESVLGYIDFTMDITDYLLNGENEIIVLVDSRETVNVTPFGGLIDYTTFGGIYREAQLLVKNATYLKNVKATYQNEKLFIELILNNSNYNNVKILINDFENCKEYFFEKNISNTYIIEELSNIVLWDLDNPHLYKITVSIDSDSYSFNFGFRKIEIKNNKFYLNDKLVNIFGLNRHQSYPHIGYAGTKNMQVIDAKILKDLGVNMVRTSHYPQSRHFLDECDRLGLLVFEELPGWQYLGDEEWKETVTSYVEPMIMRDYNHPSIVIFGVRVNESMDCDELYEKTNQIAHEIDPIRFTGGVRFIKNSHLLEDIYTFNDFSYEEGKAIEDPKDVTGLDYDVPYLISEFGGHTYPTKKIDNEHRQVEQLLRHARIHHAAQSKNMLGAIGWCAFDYNTHHQFGSGDKVCYHGVMDIYRMPKIASKFYRGQKPLKDGVVLEEATIFAYGERNYGGVTPLYVFTNCDDVKLFVGEKEYQFKRVEEFQNFKNPIFVLDTMEGAWGSDWLDGRLVGYINKKVVSEKILLANQIVNDLDVKLYDEEIEFNDATRIEVRLVDKVGNTLRFADSILNINAINGDILAPNSVALYGGEYAFYVRSNSTDDIRVKINCLNYNKDLIIKIKKM